jgi:hypothetical protein
MWASAAVLSTHQMIEVWRVVAGRISFRKIHKAKASLTLKEIMHLNASLSLTQKAQRHIKMLLT